MIEDGSFNLGFMFLFLFFVRLWVTWKRKKIVIPEKGISNINK